MICDATQRVLTKIFIRFLQIKEFKHQHEDQPPMKEYRTWLLSCFNETRVSLLDLMKSAESQSSQLLALENLMKLAITEGKYPISHGNLTKAYFPRQQFNAIIKNLMDSSSKTNHLVTKFIATVGNTCDGKYYVLKGFNEVFDSELNSNEYATNCYSLLTSINPDQQSKGIKRKAPTTDGGKEVTAEDEIPKNYLLIERVNPAAASFLPDEDRLSRLFSDAWLKLLSLEHLPEPIYKKVLKRMDKHILPHLHKPLLMTDFLFNSFNINGEVSLLALSSIFTLIQNHNLEYPDFYPKVYSLLEPNLLYTEHRSEYFFWTDIFMSSTALPAYYVASFVKRASRVALTAPIDALTIIIPFIANMLIRYKDMVSSMINRPEIADLTTDPFDNDETDLSKTNAMESALWELKTLQNHWHPKVASAAQFINRNLPTDERSLAEVLNNTFDEMLEETMSAAMKKKVTTELETPLADKISAHFFGLTA